MRIFLRRRKKEQFARARLDDDLFLLGSGELELATCGDL
jgi:hypothetical protein